MKKNSHSIHNTDNDWVVDYNGTGVSGYKFTSKEDAQSTFFSQSRVCSMAYGSLMQVLSEHIGRTLSTTNIQMMRTYY